MREEKQRLILEGLPKGDIITRNKVFLKSVRVVLEKWVGNNLEVGGMSIYKYGIHFLFNVRIKKGVPLDTYTEGEIVVISLPISAFEVTIEIDRDGTFESFKDTPYLLKDFKLWNKYTDGERKRLGQDREFFDSELGEFLNTLEREAQNTLIVTKGLDRGVFSEYHRRDCLPLVSFDMKEHTRTYYRRDEYSGEWLLNGLPFIIGDSPASFLSVQDGHDIPYGLVRMTADVRRPRMSESLTEYLER